MSRRNQLPKGPKEGLSREEGRYLDGEASPEEARRMEHLLAADPARAGRLEAWQQAMDLWREDAEREACFLQAGSLQAGSLQARSHPEADGVSEDGGADLADLILQGGPSTLMQPLRSLRAAPWYAAAAALLMTIGVTGTLLARSNTSAPVPPHFGQPPQLSSLSDGVVEVMIDGPELLPGLATTKEGR